MLAAVEEHRSTWQSWHVRAEAQRHVRTAEVPADQVDQLVDLLVDEVLDARSVALTRTRRRHRRTATLRRTDGSSVYTVAGADLLHFRPDPGRRAAPRRRRRPPRRAEPWTSRPIDLALLEWPPTGTPWMKGRLRWSGDVHLRGPAAARDRPGRRREDHRYAHPGPSLDRQTAARSSASPRRPPRPRSFATPPVHPAETLAKLTWSIQHGDLPDWADRIGRSTLVIIDEAGMADTLSLDTAVQFVIGRGGSVRLIGDDQQLAAIGAGGVLRDIQAQPRRGPAHRAAPLYRPRRSRRHPCAPRRPTGSPRLLPGPATRPCRRPDHHHSTESSTLGRPTAATVSTRSCWPRPGSWSAA